MTNNEIIFYGNLFWRNLVPEKGDLIWVVPFKSIWESQTPPWRATFVSWDESNKHLWVDNPGWYRPCIIINDAFGGKVVNI